MEFAKALARSAGSLYGAAGKEPSGVPEGLAAAFGRDTQNLFKKVNLQAGDV